MRNFALLSLLSILVAAADSRAEEESLICAAIVPCDSQGEVLEGFREGECAPLYADLCKKQKINELEGSLAACSEGGKQTQQALRKLQAELKKTKRALREARMKEAS